MQGSCRDAGTRWELPGNLGEGIAAEAAVLVGAVRGVGGGEGAEGRWERGDWHARPGRILGDQGGPS